MQLRPISAPTIALVVLLLVACAGGSSATSARTPSDPVCSGDYGCSDDVQYRCTIDTETHTCKWQSAAPSSGGCSGGPVTPGSAC